MSTQEKHLYYLSELKDYKVNHHDHDIRGWMVKDLDNRVIGKVDNLLVNKELGKVVYIDVEVNSSIIDANHDPYSAPSSSKLHEFINKEGENHIIIPIGLIDLNPDEEFVYTERIDYQTFAETKRYKSGNYISRDYERHVLGSYNRREELDNEDDEIHRTRTAYNDKKEVNELRDSEARSSERMEEERLKREKRSAQTKHSKSEPAENQEDYLHSNRYINDDYSPEPTLDEDSNWEKNKQEPLDENAYHKRKRNRRENEESFYDRREFRDQK